MSTAGTFLRHAEFSVASYAVLTPGQIDPTRLAAEAVGMTQAQAARFSTRWRVIDQFDDPSGLSATIFQEVVGGALSGPKYLAIRGTQPEAGDLLAGGLLALGVSERLNPQYSALKAQVDNVWGIEGGPLHGQAFTVAGHSLGGYLAAALKEQYGQDVISAAYLFNAPGSGGLVGNIADLLANVFGQSVPGADGVWNIKASEGMSIVAALGSQASYPVPVHIEDGGLGAANHSIARLTDALAVHALYATLDPTLTIAQSNALMDASGASVGQTLESALDALRTLLGESSAGQTHEGDRNSLYVNIRSLMESNGFASVAGTPGTQVTVLADQTAAQILEAAGGNDAAGLAVRYALKALNPFALIGADYSPFNDDGALELYATAQPGGMTAQYLADRANFLERKLWFSTEDVSPVDPFSEYNPQQPQTFANEPDSRFFIDAASGYAIRLGALFNNARIISFGDEKPNVLRGQMLEDRLYGDGGTDVLIGGLGDGDYLEGGAAFDLYQFSAGGGKDTIFDADGKGAIVRGAVLALGIEQTEGVWAFGGTTFTRSDADLVVTFEDNAEDQITVKGFDFAKAAGGGYLGVRLLKSPIAPTAEVRTFIGDKQDWDSNAQEDGVQTVNDPFGNAVRADGQDGRPDLPQPDREDTFTGSTANEVEKFITGDGNDAVNADGPDSAISAAGGIDRIETGAGRDTVAAGTGNDWIEGGADGDVLGGNAGEDTIYADASNGQTLTLAQAIAAGETGERGAEKGDLLSGDDGDDVLIGAATDDLLLAGRGSDVVVAGAGHDNVFGDAWMTFASLDWLAQRSQVVDGNFVDYSLDYTNVFGGGRPNDGGADVIYGGTGEDWIMAGGGDDHVDGARDDDVIFGEGGGDILLGGHGDDALVGDGASIDELGLSGDDYLDGGEGRDGLIGGNGSDILVGGAGDDTLVGGEGDDVYWGGIGDDIIVVGPGKDTYVYNRGDGRDTVVDVDKATAGVRYLNAIALGPGITRSDVRFKLGSLAIDLGGGDEIHLHDFDRDDPASTPVVASLQFADGEVMTYADILAQGFDIDGADGIDVIFGTPQTDRIDAKGGDDTVIGRAGNDAILGGAGDDYVEGNEGDDAIDGDEGSDQLAGGFGADVLQGGEGDDALAGESGNDALSGGAGADSLAGDDGDDQLRGGAGDDLLIGGTGADAYLFSAGDGNDGIDEQGLLAQGVADPAADVIRFDASVVASQVATSRLANGDLVVRYGSGDAITVFGQYAQSEQAIERIEFADGSGIDKAALDALPVAPLTGTSGNDTLGGTPADDTLAGEAGADTYQVYFGMGRDTVVDPSPSVAEIGTLALAPGLTLDSLKVVREGDDLAVQIRGTSDAAVIQGYFASETDPQVWQIADADGALASIQDLIDRPDPNAGNVALSAREDYRQGILSGWKAQNFAPVLPTHAFVFSSWSQTTFTYFDNLLQPHSEVQPPVTHFSVSGYGIRSGAGIAEAPLVQRSIGVGSTLQESDAAVIFAEGVPQSSVEFLQYGVTTGAVIPGHGSQSGASTSSFATGALAINTIVSRFSSGWAPVTSLVPGGGGQDVLTIQHISEQRVVEEINAGDGDSEIHGAPGAFAGHVALIDAGGGNDTIHAGADDFAYGNEGDDHILGGAVAYGGNGADLMEGGAALFGGAGSDSLTGAGFLDGGSGDDRLVGLQGATTFRIDPAEVGADLAMDFGAVPNDDLREWYASAVNIGRVAAFLDGGDRLGGLFAVVGDTRNALYDGLDAAGGYEPTATVIRLEDADIPYLLLYASLEDLRADLAAAGLAYRAPDVLPLLSTAGLRANDYARLAPFVAQGLIEQDIVEFDAGVSPQDLAFAWSSTAIEDPITGLAKARPLLEMSWGASGSLAVAVPVDSDPVGTGIERFRFSDGTVLSMGELLSLAPLLPRHALATVEGSLGGEVVQGSADAELVLGHGGDDQLRGEGGNDVLDGGEGSDVLEGGGGADTYLFGASDAGIDQVAEREAAGAQYLDWYYDQREIDWRWAPEYQHYGEYRIFRHLGTGLNGYQYFDTFEQASQAAAADRGQRVTFVAPPADLAPVVRRDDTATLQQLVAAGAMDKDVIELGTGLALTDLTLTVVVDAEAAAAHPEQPWHDGGTLQVRWNDGASGFDLEIPDVHYGFVGTNLHTDGESGAQADGAWRGYAIGRGIEAFAFADGTEIWLEDVLRQADVVATELPGVDLEGTPGNDTLVGTPGADSLRGYDGDDFLDGRAGNDSLLGGSGEDTYVLSPGGGSDLIERPYGAEDPGGEDRILADETLSPDQVFTSRDWSSLFVRTAAGDARIEVARWFEDEEARLAGIEFADGTFWDADEMEARMRPAPGTDGDDAIFGSADADVINALGGEDEVYGEGGDDVLAGGIGSDILSGGEGNDVLDGGADDDNLEGGEGSDTYVFGGGFGWDYVYDESETEGEVDTIRFGDGIAPADVAVNEAPWGALFLRVNGTSDRVEMDDWRLYPASRIEQVVFADGTTWSADEVIARIAPAEPTPFDDVLMGTPGDDIIAALEGHDQLDGGGGNDILYGNEGDDFLGDTEGRNYADGGAGADGFYAEGAAALFVGAGGADFFNAGDGAMVVAFNPGDGNDGISAGADTTFTLSLGGGLGAQDVRFAMADAFTPAIRLGDETLTFHQYYRNAQALWPAGRLQIIGTDVRTYDLNTLFLAFYDALDGDAGLDEWHAEAELEDHLISVSSDHAIGGAIAYAYASTGSTMGLTGSQIGAVLAEESFAVEGQPILLAGNQAPVLQSPLVDQTLAEDAPFSHAIPEDAFVDPDAGDTLSFSALLANDAVLPAWLSFDAATRTFAGTPTQADVGSLDVRVTVSDGHDAQASDVFQLTVTSVNDAPVEATPLADHSFEAGATFSFAIPEGTFLDEDGDALALSAGLFGGTALPGWLSFDAATGTFTGAPQLADMGVSHIEVVATDAGGASASSDFGLVVRAPAGGTASGGAGDDVLYGGAGDETLVARGGSDYLNGDAGNDLLRGGGGNDVLQGGAGSDVLRGGVGQNVLDGGAGDDLIYGGQGSGFLTGGAGNDTLRVGRGNDVIGFNAGDGVDTVYGGRDGGNTLSFGGGIGYEDLSLARSGRDLVVSAGENDQVILKNWYGGNHSVASLQILLDASEEFDATSQDPLYNRKVQRFDFLAMVSAYDSARQETPGLSSWQITNALLQFHLSGSDDFALGGDLAYWYSRNRTLGGISLSAAQQAIGAPEFGSDAQSLRPFDGLQEGFVKLS